MPIKNPYSNVPFKKSTLYNIYYFLKYKTNNYSDLFHKFFISNFNMSIFFNNYEHLLREHSIKNYVSTSPNCILRSEIIKMLKVFNLSREEKYKIIIDKEFPDNLLIKIMRPYLLLYFKQLYSLIPIVKENAKCELKHKLYLFNKEYPMFGKRKILTSQKLLPNFKSRLYVSGVEFLSEHKPFQNETLSSFLSDHLEVDENHYYEDENNEFILNNTGNNINNINNINNLIMQNEYYFEDEAELVYEDDDDNSIS